MWWETNTFSGVTVPGFVGMIKNAQRILDQAKAIAPKDARVVEEAKELKRSS